MSEPQLLPYEQQVYSQHWEDGIIQLLTSGLIQPNRIAIEVCSGDGRQNMLRNLIENHGYLGIGHDLLPAKWSHDRYVHREGFITLDTIPELVQGFPSLEPDFFSLDIDSFDFWLLKDLLAKHDFRPRVICVEYLCYYGPHVSCSVKPRLDHYDYKKCGASVMAFKKLLAQHGYEFFTVDTTGVNAFFYLPEYQTSLTELSDLPILPWAFFGKYRDLIKKLMDPDIEWDEQVLFSS